ncbi:(deoxy)nucleoside triphosphate pyrophosphohydrolase [Amycolatopsis magusensis]|uniref:8-oxo-dGTP diphosphatase n=1 Tax=Amycolatopsis magusensis TaxID=882444 RepID=A0ABS4PH32_9PSEU|nr:NUDIX domain-containing protein [Amycolatopsis magusensis]MBP2178717.1 8-oxo-dGTP diphosphatase [Amycolatopsis magusensis]
MKTVVGAAIVRDGKLLAQQRAWPADADGKWELPGGRVEPDESEVDALRRECLEELDAAITVRERVGPDVPLPGGSVLRIYAALIEPDVEPRAVEHRDLRWLSAADLDSLDWLPADRVLIPDLTALLVPML